MIKTSSSNEKKKLLAKLISNAEIMIQAGLSHTTRTCGKQSCACRSDPSRRHGPNAYLNFRTADGRSSGMYVAPEHLEEVQQAKQAWQEFRQLATKLAAINRKEMRLRWQTARKARAER